MYSKIAINNVKRSFKDYAIYFLTISFAVCIFYSFNSIESQKALLDINKNQAEYITYNDFNIICFSICIICFRWINSICK